MSENKNKTDIDFAKKMIPHHEEALIMALEEISNGVNPQIKDLAKRIYDGQLKEIQFLKNWLKTQGQSIPSSHLKM